jgi:3-oxoacyl-[acyl-carrier-protein] synthase-3
MAFVEVKNVEIKGLSVAVPKEVKTVKEQPFFTSNEAENFTAVTGVESSHLAPLNLTLSDLCFEAAQKLLTETNTQAFDIDLIMFVSTSRDFYICPNTANILQHRLGLKTSCVAIDLPFACSGYVYGLYVAGSLLQSGQLKRALLLVGEMPSKNQSSTDKTVWPLHGDAGSATLLEFSPSAKNSMKFNLNGDGSGFEAIICRQPGIRNYPVTEDSLKSVTIDNGIERNALQCEMDGSEVFAFAIKKPLEAITALAENFQIDIQQIDYLLIHQANKMIDEKIRKKLKLPAEKVPYSMRYYGNTSSCTIPLTMVSQISQSLSEKVNSLIMCGFGSGLSWGAAHIITDKIICLPVIEV